MADDFVVNTTTTGSQNDPSVTGLANGTFVVTWQDYSESGGDTSGSAVRGQVFTADGVKQGAEFLVNTTTMSYQYYPSATGLANGTFVVTWTDRSQSGGDTSGSAVRGQVFTAAGVQQGTEFLVNTTTAGDQNDPSVTGLANGGFVVTWRDWSQSGGDTSDYAMRGQVFTAAGVQQGKEFLVNTTTTSSQFSPSVTGLANGTFVVTWSDASQSGGDTSDRAVRGQVFTAAGVKQGTEFLVNTTTTNNQHYPSVTGLANGTFVVTWMDSSQSGGDTSDSAVRGQVFTAAGVKQGTEFLVNTTTTSGQYSPSVTELANGGFVVTWTDASQSGGDTSNSAIRGQVFTAAGVKQGTEFLVNTTTTGEQFGTSVTGLANGTFVVTWNDESQSGGDISERAIRGRVFNADGTPYEPPPVVLTGDAGNNTLTGGAGNDILSGLAGNDTLFGLAGIDTLFGGPGSDTLYGGLGNDTMYGGQGNDTLFGGQGNDLVYGAKENDILYGALGDDTLLGGQGNDILLGGQSNDVLNGANDNDILNAGIGNDTLTGGAGWDIFTFSTALSASDNVDTLADFSVLEDTIQLSKTIFAELTSPTPETLNASFFHASSTGQATDSDDYVVYNTSTGALFYDADGSGAGAAVQFATLTGNPTLTNQDFVVVA